MIKRQSLVVILLHSLFWILSFTQGIFQLLNLSSAIYKIGILIIVAILIILKLLENKKINFLFFRYIAVFIIISIISLSNGKIEYFTFIYFIFYTCINYFYFIILINENDIRILNYIYKFVIGLFLIQLPAAIIKFIYLGQSEKGAIGTLSTSAGSLSSIIPLFAVAFLFSAYLFKHKIIYIILILCFVLFGIIGEKRFIVGMVPAIMFITFIYFIIKMKRADIGLIFKYLLIGLIGGGFLLYMGVRLSPTLNPDNKIMGSFDLSYAINYALNYENPANRDMAEMPRSKGIIYFAQYLYEKGPIYFLIGDGAGKLVESQYSDHKGTMLDMYGVRYGGRMGFVWLYLQVGVLGVLFYLLFYFALLRLVWKNIKYKFEYLAFIMIGLVFFIDFSIYSDSSIKFTALNSSFLLLGSFILNDIREHNYEPIKELKT